VNIIAPLFIAVVNIFKLTVVAFIITLIFPFGGFVLGATLFVSAYLPLPALALWSTVFGERKKIAGSILSLCFGLLCTYLLLALLAPENIEAIGDTIVVRHSSPALNQATDIESYIAPLITMVAVIKYYWFVLSNETLQKES